MEKSRIMSMLNSMTNSMAKIEPFALMLLELISFNYFYFNLEAPLDYFPQIQHGFLSDSRIINTLEPAEEFRVISSCHFYHFGQTAAKLPLLK